MRIQDHPVAGRLPKETEGPSIQPIHDDIRSLVARPKFPSYEELIQHDVPLIALHVTSFEDATLIGVTFPHVVMDLFGAKALLAGWSSVLAGREEDVPQVLGVREDVLQRPEIWDNGGQQEDFALEKRRLKGAGLALFLARLLSRKLWGSSRQRRAIYLPNNSFCKMRDHARRDISDVTPSQADMPFLSENDILTAWVTRAIASSLSKPRPITVLSILNLRFRLPALLQSSGSFIQNMVIGTYAFYSAEDATASIGSIALKHRQSVTEQSTVSQILAFLRSAFQDIDGGKPVRLLFGESNGVPIIFNNTIKTDLITSLDFSPAVISQGETTEKRRNPVGSVASCYGGNLYDVFPGLDTVVMVGKNHVGDYWLIGKLLPEAWAKIDEELAKL